jgi:hypothetical protein
MVVDTGTPQPRSRRAILAGAIGGLAGLVGSRLGAPDRARAAAGGPVIMGAGNSAGTTNTSLTTASSGTALLVSQTGSGTALRGFAVGAGAIGGFFTAHEGTGVSGVTANANSYGVYAANDAGSTGTGAAIRVNGELNHGVNGTTNSPDRDAVRATNTGAVGTGAAMRATGGNNPGLVATSLDRGVDGSSPNNYGVYGTGGYCGVRGQGGTYGAISSGTSVGVYGSGPDYGLYGAGGTYGLYAGGSSYGVYGSGPTGVLGSGSTYGVVGTTTNVNSDAVRGDGGQYGIHGVNARTAGVRGDSGYVGGWGQATSYGIYGLATDASATSYGVFGQASNASSYGVWCQGAMHVAGTLSKTAGSFKIDHPLDPGNRWLSHSFVESPDMMNVYNGNAVLDQKGEATIQLPDYFGALNRDFRYQLTTIGKHAPVYVADKIARNQFRIAGGTAGLEVSWQVTGIRQDDYAKAHPIVVETAKKGVERGARQFVPQGSTAKLMKVGPAGAGDPVPASPTVVPHKVTPKAG